MTGDLRKPRRTGEETVFHDTDSALPVDRKMKPVEITEQTLRCDIQILEKRWWRNLPATMIFIISRKYENNCLDRWKSYSLPKHYDCPFETSEAGSGGYVNGAIYFAQCGIVQLQLEFGKSSMIPFWTGKLARTSNTKLGKSQSAWFNDFHQPALSLRKSECSTIKKHISIS